MRSIKPVLASSQLTIESAMTGRIFLLLKFMVPQYQPIYSVFRLRIITIDMQNTTENNLCQGYGTHHTLGSFSWQDLSMQVKKGSTKTGATVPLSPSFYFVNFI